MRTCDLVAFSASISARLDTAFGASRMRWRSLVGAWMCLKSVKSTLVFAGSISLAITVLQFTVCSFHPRRLCARDMLLTYAHSFLSSSVYCVEIYMFRAGV
jgi:hypothetical protein